MLNIHIKGELKNEEQLMKEKELPEKAIQFKEGKTLNDAFNLGFVLSLPIMLPMIIVSIMRCSGIDKQVEFDISFVVAAVITVISGKLLIYLHECIHAIFYPIKAEKTVWKYTKQVAYFIYCDAKISKIRFIILSLAPSVILGIIPFFIWYIAAPMLEVEWIVCIMILTWMMTFMSMGDFANAFHAMKQVPKGAKVFNYGMHSYWIE